MNRYVSATAASLLGLTLVFAVGCGEKSDTPAAAGATTVDFSAEATRTIDKSNAEAALKELEAQIESDTSEVAPQ